MNIIFTLILVASTISALVIDPTILYTSMISGAQNGIQLLIKLTAIYVICMAILDIMDKIGLNRLLSRILSPITRRLFKGEDPKTMELVNMNFATNLLGMGSASTPLGIEATKRMSGDRLTASDNAILFLVINATSIQLIPTTIIGLRATAGSVNPSDIIIPSLISTSIATIVGVIICKILSKCHG